MGKPDLVVFSDGSVLAFGAVAYVRWLLESGEYWTALVMSKSKVAPKNRITVPRLELNGAVLAKRLKEFIVGQIDVEFGNVFHLVDSSTVLGYVHKADSKLKPFEGIRVSEIQRSGEFVQGRLKDWSWVETLNNPADWATKPRSVAELAAEGFWQRGPSFLKEDISRWPIKLDFKTERLEGEIMPKNVHVVLLVSEQMQDVLSKLLENSSHVRKLFRVMAYTYKWINLKDRSVARASPGCITVEEISRAKELWLKFVQNDVREELIKSVKHDTHGKVHGQYRRLSVFEDDKGIWRVGLRLREYAPFTLDKQPPAFVPSSSR